MEKNRENGYGEINRDIISERGKRKRREKENAKRKNQEQERYVNKERRKQK